MSVKVHVNSNVIRSNAKHGLSNPPLTVRRGKAVERGFAVELLGASRVIYRPEAPLACGAKVWIEAEDARVLS